jgi:hypothetical protein
MNRRVYARALTAGQVLTAVLVLSACTKDATASPTAVLDSAIRALEGQARYSFTETINHAGIPGDTATYKVVVQQADEGISVAGATNVVAIGSTRYRQSAGVWKTVHETGESAKLASQRLWYVNLLKKATSVSRSGDTFTVPATEVAALLARTGSPQFKRVTHVSYVATVESGVLRSVTVKLENAHFPTGSSPLSATVTVTALEGSPMVTAPHGAVP